MKSSSVPRSLSNFRQQQKIFPPTLDRVILKSLIFLTSIQTFKNIKIMKISTGKNSCTAAMVLTQDIGHTNMFVFIQLSLLAYLFRSGKLLVIVRHIRLPVGLICGCGAKLR